MEENMKNITVVRIDDRLIHGQVATMWLKYTDSTYITVIDDGIKNNPFLLKILKAAAPSGTECVVFSTQEAIDFFLDETPDDRKIFVITKVPGTLLKMIEAGVKFEKIILGGMGMGPGRKRFIKNVSASDEEVAQMGKIIKEHGVKIYYQVTPRESPMDIKDNV